MTRTGRSLDDVKLPPWRILAFADLHYGAKTQERALDALARIRELALEHRAKIVFCGDFWETRGVLSMRQVDPLLDEFYRWRAAGLEAVLIPGNHDQVSSDGRLHNARIFEPFHNIAVATDPLLITHSKLAFLPWRQEPGEQAALFDDLPGDGWTIFAHAEVRGARTNYGYEAPGRVSVEQIERKSRAAYLGHFHMRQQHGEHTWYLGNPFEKDFGEMGDPKGVALITEDNPVPNWIDFEGFPRHHRVTLGVPFDVTNIAEHDVVELYAARDRMDSDEMRATLDTIPAQDVRPLPLENAEDEDKPPEFALSLDQAIDRYVEEGEAVGPVCEALKTFGRAILAELPEAKAILPMTPEVVVQGVEVSDFCAIAGDVTLNLDKQGLLLLKGPIGVGKTSLSDAITWALYGQTSPRKAGASGATFRGDEVIYDGADTCEVSVQLSLPLLDKRVVVTRSKKRGAGAKAVVQGIDKVNGISDTQDLINHVMGMDYDLWRTCVSLGQGAVGNFVTDADKARKDLLSQAFGLSACPVALKFVRNRLKPLRAQTDKLDLDLATETRGLEVLDTADYAEQVTRWEDQRAAAKDATRDAGERAKATVEECVKQLSGKQQWLELKQKHESHTETLQRSLSEMTMGAGLVTLEREHGGLSAEQAVAQQSLGKARKEHADLEGSFAKSQDLPCPTCGQPMKNTQSEKLVAQKAHDIERLERSIRTFETRMQNVAAKIQDATRGTETKRTQIGHQLSESRTALEKVGQALNTFVRFEANKVEADRRLAESRATWAQKDTEINPFKARAEEHEEKLAALRQTVLSLQQERATVGEHLTNLEFWEQGFSAKGLPVLVLRTALHELELYANKFLGQFLVGRIYTQLEMQGDNLGIHFFERCEDGEVRERRYEQLSGGMRRCVELAFSPFALSEMVFNRCGVRVPLLVIDELTTHLGQEEKPLVCEVLRSLPRDTVLVIDHDAHVQGEFDTVLEVSRPNTDTIVEKVS